MVSAAGGARCVLGGARSGPAPGSPDPRAARAEGDSENDVPSDSGGGAGSLVSLGGGSIADGPAGSLRGRGPGGAPQPRGQGTPKKKEQSPARLEPRGTGTSSTPPASQAGSEGTAASEGDSGARGGDARLAGRRQRSSFLSGNLSGGGGSTAGELLGETGGTTSGGEEEVHRPSHSGAGGSGIICAYGDETRTDEEEDTKAVFSRDSGSPARGGSREGTDARSHSSRGPNGETDSRARGEPISEPREFSETRGASGSVGTRRGARTGVSTPGDPPITPRAQTRAEASFRTPPALFRVIPAARPWAAPAGTASPSPPGSAASARISAARAPTAAAVPPRTA